MSTARNGIQQHTMVTYRTVFLQFLMISLWRSYASPRLQDRGYLEVAKRLGVKAEKSDNGPLLIACTARQDAPSQRVVIQRSTEDNQYSLSTANTNTRKTFNTASEPGTRRWCLPRHYERAVDPENIWFQITAVTSLFMGRVFFQSVNRALPQWLVSCQDVAFR